MGLFLSGRGRIVDINQLWRIGGIQVAYCVYYTFSTITEMQLNVKHSFICFITLTQTVIINVFGPWQTLQAEYHEEPGGADPLVS